MSRLFLSHSSINNAEVVALHEWLAEAGWEDVFLDLDTERGIAAGERWEHALVEAASRCEAVLFLISRAWLESRWCLREFMLAHRLNKRLFGVLIETLDIADLPKDLSSTWQAVNLASGQDHRTFHVTLPQTQEKCDVSFSREGLTRLRAGLVKAGLDPRFFEWPPKSDPNRPPYRGLLPLEADDAGIFFGRDSPIVEAVDKLRGLRAAPAPRLLVILGASGAGKSSFLRAGLFARMVRDDRNFVPLPIIRPEQAAITGQNGLLRALEQACRRADIPTTLTESSVLLDGGARTLVPVLKRLCEKARPTVDVDASATPPALVISIDQGEELFLTEGRDESKSLLVLLTTLLADDELTVIVVISMRSDSYAHLQEAGLLGGARPELFDLGPMPRGSYTEVIKGPATRLAKIGRPLKIEDGLVDVLLHEIEVGGAKDALPLLSFTLERLYLQSEETGALTVAGYYSLGGIKGSIEEAVERAFTAADADPDVPDDRSTRLKLLRRGFIPWLASVDPDTRAPRRRVARLAEIPVESHALLQHLVEQRLLTTDVSAAGGVTIEPAHEALLRQWDLLQGWLTEDEGLLAVLEGVKRAAREWSDSGNNPSWLAHSSGRLEAAERLSARSDLAANLEPAERNYVAACRKAESTSRKRRRYARIGLYTMLIGIIIGLLGWINQATIIDQFNWFTKMRPYMISNFRPYVLSAEAEQQLKPGDEFVECAKDCPKMIVVPPGEFTMGSPVSEKERTTAEGPTHQVTISHAFAVSKFDVTYDDWDACVAVSACPPVSDSGFGRGQRPVTNVTWDNAQLYVKWLARMTGRPYRLLTESEWEYAARAGSTTTYWWGDQVGENNANCVGCGSQWDERETSPVGQFKPNAFGLYDVSGNVWQWVEDCYHTNYNGAPTDGSAWLTGDCSVRVDRGGSWVTKGEQNMRVAFRGNYPAVSRNYSLGFRVARTLEH